METFALVNHAIDLLASHLPSAAEVATHVGEDAAAHGLYELIKGHLHKQGEGAVMTEFVADPQNNSLIKRLVRQAVRDDPAFAAELADAVAAVRPAAMSTNVVSQTGNTVGGDLVGRDLFRNTTNSNNSTSNTQTNKSNYGGLVLGIVVIVALFLVFIVGKAVLGAISHAGLSGSSTCADYLQSSDEADKAAVMKRLYIAKQKPHLAADPFINENTEYFCGNSPTMTLDHIASVRSDD